MISTLTSEIDSNSGRKLNHSIHERHKFKLNIEQLGANLLASAPANGNTLSVGLGNHEFDRDKLKMANITFELFRSAYDGLSALGYSGPRLDFAGSVAAWAKQRRYISRKILFQATSSSPILNLRPRGSNDLLFR
jgi:hypothetical protein